MSSERNRHHLYDDILNLKMQRDGLHLHAYAHVLTYFNSSIRGCSESKWCIPHHLNRSESNLDPHLVPLGI